MNLVRYRPALGVYRGDGRHNLNGLMAPADWPQAVRVTHSRSARPLG